MDLKKVTNEFWTNGYAVIPDFLRPEEISEILTEMDRIANGADIDEASRHIFETGTNQTGNEYFIESGDKIRLFFEKDAFDQNGKLRDRIERSINKIGHALHWHNPIFKRITFSDRIREVVRQVVDFRRPVIPQSMVIYKNAGIGGVVVPHQDASFLYTRPEIRLLGIWLALDDVTVEPDNGCLWFIPGSHNSDLDRRFIRNPNSTDPPLIFTNDGTQYDSKLFVPAPVRKGSCVLIHGLVVHKSERNQTDRSRPAYTFHVIDSDNQEWAGDNWLQPTKQLPFPELYKD